MGFAVKELLRDVPMDSAQRELTAAGIASADQLLRSIDDVRELLSHTPAPAATLEEFDLTRSAGEIVEALNLASDRRAPQIVLDPSIPFVMMTQDRRVVEQTLTRILDTALKLTEKGKAPLRLSIGGGQDPVRIAITIYEAALAVRLANWLNINPDGALFQERDDLPFGIALMVAGKHLRALGGAIDLARDKKGHHTITLDLPSLGEAVDREYRAGSEALNILVAEDCDESFVLTQGVLQEERVSRARDGSEALRMIQKQRFDVVFMDIHMPGMNGYEAIRSMRDWETQTGNARTPMVVLSSDDLETQERSAAEFGCSGFLLKPLRRLDLAPLLERLK